MESALSSGYQQPKGMTGILDTSKDMVADHTKAHKEDQALSDDEIQFKSREKLAGREKGNGSFSSQFPPVFLVCSCSRFLNSVARE